jgi:hypothetical protein
MALSAPIMLHQYRGHVQTAAPAAEPVTAAELRDYLREDATALPDADANELVAEAREAIENTYAVAMIDQSWRMAIDRWPSGREEWWDGIRDGSIADLYGPASYTDLRLPRWPLSTVDSVTVYDEDGTSTAVTIASTFDVDTYQTPGRITLQRGATWPVALRANNAIEIVYTAGYGADASSVPAPLKRAVKQLAAYLYSHRGDMCDMGDAMHDSGAGSIMGQYKIKRV